MTKDTWYYNKRGTPRTNEKLKQSIMNDGLPKKKKGKIINV